MWNYSGGRSGNTWAGNSDIHGQQQIHRDSKTNPKCCTKNTKKMWAEKLQWGIRWGNFYKEKETTRYEKSAKSKIFLIWEKVIKNISKRGKKWWKLWDLTDDLRQTSRGFMNNLDLMYNFDESDWKVLYCLWSIIL